MSSSIVLTDEDIMELHEIAPHAAALTSLENSDTDTASSGSDTETEEELCLPDPLTALYDSSLRQFCPHEIQIRSKEVYKQLQTNLQPIQYQKLELITRQQSQSKVWFTYRAGRITSTKFHRVCTTDKISIECLKDIMQYSNSPLEVPSVRWGKSMEAVARQCYAEHAAKKHEDFTVTCSGLVVSPQDPHLGSSPDGMIDCSCCGKGVLEIKCPYKYKDGLHGSTGDKKFCLDHTNSLKKSHPYYYQVQFHMHVCNVSHCDFVVWTKQEFVVQRIMKDQDFLLETMPKAYKVFISVILPELLTRQNDPCLKPIKCCKQCGRPQFGKMIECVRCLSAFHYSCAGIKRKTQGWLCVECKI